MRLPLPALTSALALGAACAAGSPAPSPSPAPQDSIVVVPVEDDGQPHFCCEYTEDGETKFALLAGPRACTHRFGDRDGEWVEGPQCLPCCCQTPLSAERPSLGYRRALTVPSACAGVGHCVSRDFPECEPPRPGKAKRGRDQR